MLISGFLWSAVGLLVSLVPALVLAASHEGAPLDTTAFSAPAPGAGQEIVDLSSRSSQPGRGASLVVGTFSPAVDLDVFPEGYRRPTEPAMESDSDSDSGRPPQNNNILDAVPEEVHRMSQVFRNLGDYYSAHNSWLLHTADKGSREGHFEANEVGGGCCVGQHHDVVLLHYADTLYPVICGSSIEKNKS